MKIVNVALVFVLVILGGCLGLDVIGNFFGGNTPPGELPPSVHFFGTAGPLLPGGLGALCLILAKAIHSGIKIKRALFESTQHAIDTGTLANADTKIGVKSALNEAQNLHDQSKLLKIEYDKYKNGGIFSKTFKFFRRFFPSK